MFDIVDVAEREGLPGTSRARRRKYTHVPGAADAAAADGTGRVGRIELAIKGEVLGYVEVHRREVEHHEPRGQGGGDAAFLIQDSRRRISFVKAAKRSKLIIGK
ncbi:hypothetical protein [Amycolatopsis sp. DSM 110486]|uniref:hypothetical protein n=1 Tax=Amycolatopsis sp. DSM 110486 TaxID=2865832 RepID=UPI001C6A1584|nr:hypothetical protein [Amycolatopsis sp. DSM 110486]QYN23131.1 hypothetical protein K1T34_12130 [Amycolatopsis sp. DSM 110486]